MGSYGRNFDFRVMPHSGERGARFMLNPVANIPIGTPVKYDGSIDTSSYGSPGVMGVSLALGAQPPLKGLSGIAVYEYAPAAFAGFDPVQTTYSDLDFIPAGKLCQVVHGGSVKVVLTNTTAFTFLNTRNYAGRVMVAGLGGATSADPWVGTMLTPGNGNDTAGYWTSTATSANAWLIVTSADDPNTEVEAVMAF